MANQKISQMPAATTLTGAELVELVQVGVNVQATASALIGQATPGAVNATLASMKWAASVQSSQAANQSPVGPTTNLTWTSNGTTAVQASTPAGAGTILGSVALTIEKNSSAVTNNSCDTTMGGQIGAFPCYRAVGASPLFGGFVMLFKGGFITARVDQTAFIGLTAVSDGVYAGAQTPSNFLNSIGFGKDQADTNLQFMVNNGAGSAAKTDTGWSFVSLLNHYLVISLSCDPAGAAITATITDLDNAGASLTFTVLNGATKNPVVNAKLQPHLYVGTGSVTATVCQLGHHACFMQFSPMG